MGCLISSGWKIQSCNKLPSGIRKIYIIPHNYIQSYTLNSDEVITLITAASGKVFYLLETKEETSELIDKQVLDDKTGSIYWETTLKIELLKSNYQLRNLYLQLLNDNYTIIVNDNNNLFWCIGKVNGAKLIQSESGPGKAKKDFNGNKMTFVAKQPLPIHQVLNTAFTYSTTVINPIDTSQPVPVNPPSQ